jgi:hypothetical protein
MRGVNKIMQNKLTPEQESFVKIANDQGFTTEITRKDILSLESNNGAKWPRWLVRDNAYRVGRGSYSLPTLGQVTESENEGDIDADK